MDQRILDSSITAFSKGTRKALFQTLDLGIQEDPVVLGGALILHGKSAIGYRRCLLTPGSRCGPGLQ